MSVLRLKLCGLNDSDQSSLRSMLRLSADRLSAEWEIVDEGPADLEIYSFDSDAGQQAWNQRSQAVTALLSNSGQVSQPVDIVLRKPLRKSNFADALNLLEEKIRLQTGSTPPQHEMPETSARKRPSLGLLLDKLKFRRKPASGLPRLAFLDDLAPVSHSQADTIKDPSLLQTWANQLPRNPRQKAATLLKNLQPLCALKLKPSLQLALLDVYRSAIHDLLFSRDISTVQHDFSSSGSDKLKNIRCMYELLNLLCTGYRQIAAHYYQRGQTPSSSTMLLLSLNRSAEQQALLILYAYQLYHKVPDAAWRQLHQLFLYQEQAASCHSSVNYKEQFHSQSLFDIYGQILLTALADPYRLPRYDVLRLYQMMAQFTDKIEVEQLSLKQINTTSNFLLTGHFCIDVDSDEPPQAMVMTDKRIREKDTTRLLNTQPALLHIEDLFKHARNRTHASLDTELRLLKTIIPHLNTTYERRYHRISTGKTRWVQIAHGINAIHQSLGGTMTHALPWQLDNQSSIGLMAKTRSDHCYPLTIGDFVGIFEQDYSVKLATIKWLFIDMEAQTHIGVELIPGKPLPVFCTPDGEAEQHPALILPGDKPGDDALITEKGLYSPRRRLRVKDHGEPYLITASGMIDSTLDYELFSFNYPPSGS